MKVFETKTEIYEDIKKKFEALSKVEFSKVKKRIDQRLFELANFFEASIVLLYSERPLETPTEDIIQWCYKQKKIVALPVFTKHTIRLFKVENPKKELRAKVNGRLEPNPELCQIIPIDKIDVALIPGIGFDEKNARLGLGKGFYKRLISKLVPTTRKISVGFEFQIFNQLPQEANDMYIDIIVTEDRILYKI